MIKLYNTLTRQKEEFISLSPKKVKMYNCGPTVYDDVHIGNLRAFVFADTLRRVLEFNGKKVKQVMNITDLGHLSGDTDEGEDKLEQGARREGKSAWDIARFYSDYFIGGMKRLNITQPYNLPKATEHIQQQIDLIKQLEAKGFTYPIGDGIYFDTSKLSDYGKLARLDIEKLKAGARVSVNPEKRHPTDFALWKFSPKPPVSGQKRDMEWDSPWGKGFPGWHIECSAMSMKYLGETIDIHTGGIDHIPVHHTNEIAQSEAATGKQFVHYWMHTNHILVDGQKISKSLGNGITLEDIEKKGFTPEALRLVVLESHYQSQAQFSWENLAAAQNRLKDIRAMADLRWQLVRPQNDGPTYVKFDEHKKTLLDNLTDDLNTPGVVADISGLSQFVNAQLIGIDQKEEFNNFLAFVDDVLGLNLLSSKDITDEQKALLASRERARSEEDWAKSDELREQLKKQGLEVRDTPHGQIWSRV